MAAMDGTWSTGAAPRRGTWVRAVQRLVFAVVLGVLLLSWPVGCTTRIVPPTPVTDPVAVYLLDHGRTPSLVVPTPEGHLARYAYGDWRYYALAERDVLSGLRALLWPTQGALGRKLLEGPATAEVARDRVRVPIEHLHAIRVEREAAYRLHARLEQQYHDGHASELANPGAELTFVHHPTSYTWFYNSNHAAADWLRELGCEVHGPAFVSRWRVDEPAADAGVERP